jgi:hypothetical protein
VSPSTPDLAFERVAMLARIFELVETIRSMSRRESMGGLVQTTSLIRRYEKNLQATIVRGFTGGYEWIVEDKKNKVALEDGTTQTLEDAQNQADAAAAAYGAKPTANWRRSGRLRRRNTTQRAAFVGSPGGFGFLSHPRRIQLSKNEADSEAEPLFGEVALHRVQVVAAQRRVPEHELPRSGRQRSTNPPNAKL